MSLFRKKKDKKAESESLQFFGDSDEEDEGFVPPTKLLPSASAVDFQLQEIRLELDVLAGFVKSINKKVAELGSPRDSSELRDTLNKDCNESLVLSRKIHSQLTNLHNQTKQQKTSLLLDEDEDENNNESAFANDTDKIELMIQKVTKDYHSLFSELHAAVANAKNEMKKRPLIAPAAATITTTTTAPNTTTSASTKQRQKAPVEVTVPAVRKQQQQPQQQQQQHDVQPHPEAAQCSTQLMATIPASSKPIAIINGVPLVPMSEQEMLMLDRSSDEQMQHIEKEVVEIVDAFREMGQLVETQQPLIDEIQKNVENANQDTKAGKENLKKAAALSAVGLTVIGAGIGTLILGPLGAVAGAGIGVAMGIGAGVGVGVGVTSGIVAGASIGAVTGKASKSISKKINTPKEDDEVPLKTINTIESNYGNTDNNNNNNNNKSTATTTDSHQTKSSSSNSTSTTSNAVAAPAPTVDSSLGSSMKRTLRDSFRKLTTKSAAPDPSQTTTTTTTTTTTDSR